jgi:hypothetical protein
MTNFFPARLHVILARKEPVGLVFRRGPSKQVCTLLWDRKQDTFVLGQWLKGRIYERRSDLSGDGKYVIYFAMNGKWDSQTKGSWTAISRAPWLKALVLLSKGDCWFGGGLFTSDRTYWLNEGWSHTMLRDSSEVRRDQTYQIPAYYGGECPGVYYLRLQRDNWQYIDRISSGNCERMDIFEKSLKKGWVLRKFAHAELYHIEGKGCYWDEHELCHRPSGTTLSYPDWEWAEWDRNRLVWAEKGCLYKGSLRSNRLQDIQLIYDFNDMTFTPIQAPY